MWAPLFLVGMGYMDVFTRISRTSCLTLVHLHANGCYHGRVSGRSGASGGEKTSILSSPSSLVHNWSSARQSPGTHLWSSGQKGWAGGEHTSWLQDTGGAVSLLVGTRGEGLGGVPGQAKQETEL